MRFESETQAGSIAKVDDTGELCGTPCTMGRRAILVSSSPSQTVLAARARRQTARRSTASEEPRLEDTGDDEQQRGAGRVGHGRARHRAVRQELSSFCMVEISAV